MNRLPYHDSLNVKHGPKSRGAGSFMSTSKDLRKEYPRSANHEKSSVARFSDIRMT